jgi:hypothetical protein
MNRAQRRAAKRRQRQGHGFDCGCTHWARIVFEADCHNCHNHVIREGWLPSTGHVGEQREGGFTCTCGADLDAIGTITETRHA